MGRAHDPRPLRSSQAWLGRAPERLARRLQFDRKATLTFENTGGSKNVLSIVSLEEQPPSPGEQPYGNNLFVATIYLLFNNFRDLQWVTTHDAFKGNTSHPQVVSRALEEFYPATAVQVFRWTSFIPSIQTISGTITTNFSRLTVHIFSCTTMIALLITTCAVCVWLATAPRSRGNKLPRDPSTLVGTAILLHSQAVCGGLITQEIFNLANNVSGNEKGWRPWGTTRISNFLTLGALACAVVVLQVTFVKSSTGESRLAAVRVDSWAHYSWTLLPSIIVTGLGLMFTGIEFSLRVLQPFANLARGGSTSTNALFDDYLFGLLPKTLWRFVRTRNVTLVSNYVIIP